jgi:hypothetical protein
MRIPRLLCQDGPISFTEFEQLSKLLIRVDSYLGKTWDQRASVGVLHNIVDRLGISYK